MKNRLWMILLLALCLLLPAAAMADGVEAYWGTDYCENSYYEDGFGESTGYIGFGTLQQALDAAKADSRITYIWLGQKIENAQYVIDGGSFTLDFDGYSVKAASGKSAFTVTQSADVCFEIYETTLYGSDACITVNGDNAKASLGTRYNSDFEAADGKPAVVVKKGTLVVSQFAKFSNDSASSDVCYEGGKVRLLPSEDFDDFSIQNASGKTIKVGNEILLPAGAKLMDGSMVVTQLAPGKTISVDAENVVIPAVVEANIEGFSGSLSDGAYLSNDGSLLEGVPSSADDGYAWYHDGILTLKNFKGYRLSFKDGDTILELIGKNSLDCSWDDALHVKDGSLTIRGSGSLNLTSEYDGIKVEEGSLTIKGGKITIAAESDAIRAEYSDVTIMDGTLNLTAEYDGIDVEDGDLLIAGGKITIQSGDHGIEIDRVNAEAGVGQFFMTGGALNITAGDEGIDAEEGITIDDGAITVVARDQGFDSSEDLVINGGAIGITAKEDDGLEASDAIIINGGAIRINSYCCGLYADDIAVNGGDLTITTAWENGLAFNAEDSLVVSSSALPVIRVAVDYGDGAVYNRLTLGTADGKPLRSFSVKTSEPDLPRTGDNTPVAFLAALLLLSLVSAFVLRRRSA